MKKQKLILSDILIVILTICLLITALFAFNVSFQHILEKQAYSLLSNEANARGGTLKARLDGQFYVLSSFARFISPSNPEDVPSLTDNMNSIVGTGEYETISYVGLDGNGFDNSNKAVCYYGFDCFNESIAGKRGIEYSKSFENAPSRTVILLSVPVYRNEDVVGVLVGSYYSDVLDALISSDSFDGLECSFICDSDGTIVAKGNVCNYFPTCRYVANAKTFSEFINYRDGVTTDEVFDDLMNGKTSSFIYYLGDDAKYGTFMPLNIGDWYIFSGVPEHAVSDAYKFLPQQFIYISITLFAIFALVFVYFTLRGRSQRRELVREKELLLRSEERFQLLDQLTKSVIFEGDFESGEIHFNKNYTNMFGRTPPNLNLVNISDDSAVSDFLHPDDVSSFVKLIGKVIAEKRTAHADIRVIDSANNYNWTRVEYFLQYGEKNKPFGLIGKLTNIDEQKSVMTSLQKKAELDPLTGVYNVSMTKNLIGEIIADSDKTDMHALLFMDIDNFKSINDNLGHAEGDRAIVELSNELKRIFRSYDIVGRVGGDEFVVFLKDVESDEALRNRVERMRVTVSENLSKSFKIHFTCSAGVAIFRRDGKDYKTLSKKADEALYTAKKLGKNRYAFYGEQS